MARNQFDFAIIRWIGKVPSHPNIKILTLTTREIGSGFGYDSRC
jgi:hypothetical protein